MVNPLSFNIEPYLCEAVVVRFGALFPVPLLLVRKK